MTIGFNYNRRGFENFKITNINDETGERQDNEMSNKIEIGIGAFPSYTNINVKSGNEYDITSKGQFSYGIELSGTYYYKSKKEYKPDQRTQLLKLGVGVGLGYYNYKSTLSTTEFNDSSQIIIDVDGDQYELWSKFTNLSEEIDISYLNLNLYLVKFKAIEVLGKLSFNINGGFSFCFPLSSTYSTLGNSDNHGYYPEWGLELYDIEQYGYNNKSFTANNTLELKGVSVGYIVSGGITYPLSIKLDLSMLLQYQKSLSNISGYDKDTFSLVEREDYSTVNQYNSMIGAGNKAGFSALGINLGLIYKL